LAPKIIKLVPLKINDAVPLLVWVKVKLLSEYKSAKPSLLDPALQSEEYEIMGE